MSYPSSEWFGFPMDTVGFVSCILDLSERYYEYFGYCTEAFLGLKRRDYI